ncbi:hypothetical protein LGN09_24100 [Burkholderia cenocepacia]|uniref:hypothetical protein n=1 Tax=Burkholderia cenocepacia TaxID=95486 RepID=UPI001CF408BD|nr:hypothetical protein [Burkholderia cenocepacia]MCA8407994.1 hypothetical protein [Burkholderia cenocepacia]
MEKRLWWLRDHANATGKREVRKHYERLPDEAQAAFDVHWELLRVRPRSDWRRPEAAKLKPEHKNGSRDLFEFRFAAGRKQQRPLGFFGPAPDEFTLLIWAIEKGSVFDPHDAVAISEKRLAAVNEGRAASVPWDDDEIGK